MVSSHTITILMPVLNEAKGIQKTIGRISKDEIVSMGYNVEILVVDGNSSDNSRRCAETLGAKVILEMRQGYGRALRTGFNAAKGEIIVVCDGDGTYPVENIAEYLQYLIINELDFVTINRLSNKENVAMGFSHRIGNKILSAVMNLLYSTKIKDSQSGMYLVRRRFLELVNLTSDGYSLAQEIKIIAFSFFKSGELEGKYYAREGQTKLSTWIDGLKNLVYLFKFKFFLKNSLFQNRKKMKMTDGMFPQ